MSKVIFETKYRIIEVIIFLIGISAYFYFKDGELINLYVLTFFVLTALLFMNKLRLFEDRIEVIYPLAFWRNRKVLFKEIDNMAEKKVKFAKGNKDIHISLKDGSKVYFSPLLMRGFDEMMSKYQDAFHNYQRSLNS